MAMATQGLTIVKIVSLLLVGSEWQNVMSIHHTLLNAALNATIPISVFNSPYPFLCFPRSTSLPILGSPRWVLVPRDESLLELSRHAAFEPVGLSIEPFQLQVLRVAHNLEILDPVIVLDSIDVVNVLIL